MRASLPSTFDVKERLVRIRRNSSAIRPAGFDTMIGLLLCRLSSVGMRPMIGALIMSCRSLASSTRVAIRSRIRVANTPRIRPATKPTAKYNATFGELGETGSAARCTTESFTGDSLPEAYSDFSTTLLRDSATLLAMSEACFASPVSAVMFTNAVFVGFVTVSCPARFATVVSRPRSSITGFSTDSVVASVGYD